jgi:hypothetical protein
MEPGHFVKYRRCKNKPFDEHLLFLYSGIILSHRILTTLLDRGVEPSAQDAPGIVSQLL